jgi:Bacterial Ig-like domain (group 3)
MLASTVAACLLLAAPSSAASDLVNTVAPAISVTPSGTPTVGDTLTLTPGTWTGATPVTVSDSAWPSGAAASSGPYKLQASDAGTTITVTETASDTSGSASTTVSVGPINAPPANSLLPTISGTPVVGDKLTANDGTWTGYPAPTFTYKWSDNSTGRTKTLTTADVGRTFNVTVTAKNAAGSASAVSALVGPVVAAPVNTGLPTIAGTAQQGDTLVASPGSWSGTGPITYNYLWSDGTTGPTDTLSAADVGQSVTVTVTASNGGGGASATSASFGPVAPPPPIAVGTSTTLQAFPSSALTNETVLLIATVTSNDGSHPPSGTITFKNGAAGISGCTNEPVAPTGQSVTVTCRTSFGAANANLTAVFTPAAGSILTASASPVDSYAIGRDSTSTSLDVSPTTDVGSSTTYTASVNLPPDRPGPVLPSGSVEFLDGGQPIPSCTNQPVSNGGATCTVIYRAPGSHGITADYHGDTNFTGSLSPAESVNVVSPPANAPRTITSTMQWTFYFSPTYTKVLALVINGANGDNVLVSCHGRGCPVAKGVKNSRRCGLNGKGGCRAHGTMNLTSVFRNKLLRVGARIGIMITRSGWVGKYYSFTIRASNAPRTRISCLAPGATKPGVGC